MQRIPRALCGPGMPCTGTELISTAASRCVLMRETMRVNQVIAPSSFVYQPFVPLLAEADTCRRDEEDAGGPLC